MIYKVALKSDEDGVSVWVPGLPGCWSQGANEQEALTNIAEAIREYLAVVHELLGADEIREVKVDVAA